MSQTISVLFDPATKGLAVSVAGRRIDDVSQILICKDGHVAITAGEERSVVRAGALVPEAEADAETVAQVTACFTREEHSEGPSGRGSSIEQDVAACFCA
jgi:hypothetical protein